MKKTLAIILTLMLTLASASFSLAETETVEPTPAHLVVHLLAGRFLQCPRRRLE